MATIQPILHVPDVDATLRYYRDVLDFTVDYVLPDETGRTIHAELNWRGADLMLAPTDTLSPVARSLLGAGVILYLTDPNGDIDTFYECVRERGAQIVDPIKTQEWGHRTFTVSDPDGYRLMFAAPVQEPGPSVVAG
jgi:uncharacterized glyoxalase superfamily protein PhnB